MIWTRITPYAEQSDQGHHVSASKGADGWRYSAWDAPDLPALGYWDWHKAGGSTVHYRRGEHLPQRSPLLGIFATAAEARACCEQQAARVAASTINSEATACAV